MTYYDSFEMDCGCRMHCTCQARRDAELARLRRRAERAEAALRGDHERCGACTGSGQAWAGAGVTRQVTLCHRCSGAGTVLVTVPAQEGKSDD